MDHAPRRTKVYHATKPNFRSNGNLSKRSGIRFQLVADVETDDLNLAFRLTNDVGWNWWLNPEVSAYVKPCRSTSVGDVIVLPNGEAYVVLACGFGRIAKTA